MDIDKLILDMLPKHFVSGFGSLMNIDKLIRTQTIVKGFGCFGSLMNIDKLIPAEEFNRYARVLAL